MRISKSDIESRVAYLNTLTGSPADPYGPRVNGVINPQAGNYHLSWAYGGVQLERMSMTKGCTGTSHVLDTGYATKSELYSAINNFISGIDASKKSLKAYVDHKEGQSDTKQAQAIWRLVGKQL